MFWPKPTSIKLLYFLKKIKHMSVRLRNEIEIPDNVFFASLKLTWKEIHIYLVGMLLKSDTKKVVETAKNHMLLASTTSTYYSHCNLNLSWPWPLRFMHVRIHAGLNLRLLQAPWVWFIHPQPFLKLFHTINLRLYHYMIINYAMKVKKS